MLFIYSLLKQVVSLKLKRHNEAIPFQKEEKQQYD